MQDTNSIQLILDQLIIPPFIQTKLLTLKDVQDLAKLYEQSKDFLKLISGHESASQEANDMLTALPKNKEYNDKFFIGLYVQHQKIAAAIDLIKNYPVENCWYIGLYLIEPAIRNQGIGTRLFQLLEQSLSLLGVKELRLIVQEQNQLALNFWLRQNFQVEKKGTQFCGDFQNIVLHLHKSL